MQPDEQPSPLVVLPSSHDSPGNTSPSPQTATHPPAPHFSSFAQAGEQWVEGNLQHEAVLVARWLHFKRSEEAAAPVADPAPVDAPPAVNPTPKPIAKA